MKSRHMSAMNTPAPTRRSWRVLPWLAALLLLWSAAAAYAQQQEVDPPGRVANLTQRHGSIVFAPDGEQEWLELPQNRPLTSGDRVWSDNGARAEIHLGSATLHLAGESHVGIDTLDDNAAQFILAQGSMNARVRELAPGESFEIGTPNVGLRVTQPGDFRIDIGADGRETRIVVNSGLATVFGEGGEAINLGAGQQATFAGRYLAQVQGQPYRADALAQWAGERNHAEDQSISARHVPRGVVGYPQLDAHGNWGQDASHGAVWYPRSLPVADWAPYRYGRWEWVQPWGWTWIDDAPWGFAPFHYGRWAMIGSRWAWVPGRMVARPVYSPALVVFVGGGRSSFSVGAGPGVGWYPLAPGEAWWPTYRASPRYTNFANFNINLGAYPRHFADHLHRRLGAALTAVREEDFRSGRRVHQNWRAVQPSVFAQGQVGVVPMRPDGRYRDAQAVMPRLQAAAAPVGVQPAMPHRFWGGVRQLPVQQVQQVQVQPQQPMVQQRVLPLEQPRMQWERERGAVREQHQAQREQERLQRDAERSAREQQRLQREQSVRQVNDQVARQQHEALRQQQEAVRQQREASREAWRQQQPRFQAQPPQVLQPQVQQQQVVPVGRTPERGGRDERGGGRRWEREDGDGRGRGGPPWQR